MKRSSIALKHKTKRIKFIIFGTSRTMFQNQERRYNFYIICIHSTFWTTAVCGIYTIVHGIRGCILVARYPKCTGAFYVTAVPQVDKDTKFFSSNIHDAKSSNRSHSDFSIEFFFNHIQVNINLNKKALPIRSL